MLIWSGKNYGYGQGKSGNLVLHKEWEPWLVCRPVNDAGFWCTIISRTF